MLRTHRAGKGPGRLLGVGLRLKEQKGSRRAPPPLVAEGRDLTWEPSRLPGLQWVGQTPSAPLFPEGPSHLPLLFSPRPPSYAPRTSVARGMGGHGRQGTGLGTQQAPQPKWAGRSPSAPLLPLLEGPSHLPLLFSPRPPSCAPRTSVARGMGGHGGQGTSLGTQQAPQPKWAGQSPSASLLPLLEGPSRLPFLISPASGAPILSDLHFSSPLSTPLCHTGSLGGSSCLLGHQVPPPAASRCPSCGETLTRHLSTPPS